MSGVWQPDSCSCQLSDGNGLRRITRLHTPFWGYGIDVYRFGERTKEGRDTEQRGDRKSFKVETKCSSSSELHLEAGAAVDHPGRTLRYGVSDNAKRDSRVINGPAL